MAFMVFLMFVASTILSVNGDCYMHNMRGSNNRLNEESATRTTGNRLFDSQNNARGGYNVGDKTSSKAGSNYDKQYRMVYFGSSAEAKSKINIEWTNQHGCGGDEDNNPHKLNCNLVLQFMCQPDQATRSSFSILSNTEKKEIVQSQIRDGTSTNQNTHEDPDDNYKDWIGQYSSKNRQERGMHEPYQWYDKCVTRKRNQGLFTADQNLEGDTSKHTRQNPGGTRSGYECPEERDYYPYWHPTDWRDMAIFAQNASLCAYYEEESYNVKSKWECVEKWRVGDDDVAKHFSEHNNEKDCTDANKEWLEFHNFLEKATELKTEKECTDKSYIWERPIYGYDRECLVPLSKPDCAASPWTRVNHLGNGATGDLETPSYVWNLPYFPSKEKQRCVIRIRYNISTDDYDPYKTDSSSNNDDDVISNDPEVDIGAEGIKFQLNLNTAQTGRTFQDRSHLFKIVARPKHADKYTIQNINVRGKRGNIVQVYPAVEYDFSPTNLIIAGSDTLVHMQWTGSNSHKNNGDGGDGQTGDDGQGNSGTDRNNVLSIVDLNTNFPMMSGNPASMFNNVKEVHWAPTIDDLNDCDYAFTQSDVFLQYASAGYYGCEKCLSGSGIKNKRVMDDKMNNAPASYRGMLLQLNPGTYNYMCSRNNAFTNRAQKATLTVQ